MGHALKGGWCCLLRPCPPRSPKVGQHGQRFALRGSARPFFPQTRLQQPKHALSRTEVRTAGFRRSAAISSASCGNSVCSSGLHTRFTNCTRGALGAAARLTPRCACRGSKSSAGRRTDSLRTTYSSWMSGDTMSNTFACDMVTHTQAYTHTQFVMTSAGLANSRNTLTSASCSFDITNPQLRRKNAYATSRLGGPL